ncbi:hypothetical protein [Methanobacterium movens]
MKDIKGTYSSMYKEIIALAPLFKLAVSIPAVIVLRKVLLHIVAIGVPFAAPASLLNNIR